MTSKQRGRPQSVLSTLLDATAQASDLPAWDQDESALVGNAYRRLQFVKANTDDAFVRGQVSKVLALLREWAEGDRTENSKHSGILNTLRIVNGSFDGPKAA